MKLLPVAQIPPFLNSYRVVAALPSAVDSIAVLVHRPTHPVHPYVVATWMPRCGDSWDSGDYHETLAGALKALALRAQGFLSWAHAVKPEQRGL